MFIEGIIVCVNYSDFLAHTLPYNRNQFNNLVVVTDTKDIKTKKLCDFYHVKCLQTDVFYENGNEFNKGAAINYALQSLEQKDWVIHLDADIYLPPLTRHILENLPLEKHKIYGADRLMCPSYNDWIEFINNPKEIQEGWIYIHSDAFPMGVRIAEYMNKNSGWEPIGYFQLWNPKGSGVTSYPTEHDYCDRTDVLHVKKFSRQNRELLPEILVIHLDSEGLGTGDMGKNWRGRKTALFQYEPITKEDQERIDDEIKVIISKLEKIVKKYNLPNIYVYVNNNDKNIIQRFFGKSLRIFYSTKTNILKKYFKRFAYKRHNSP